MHLGVMLGGCGCSLTYARFGFTISAKFASLVECSRLAGSLSKSHGLFSVADVFIQISDACPAAGPCRCLVLSDPCRGVAGLRDCGVAVEAEWALESGLVGSDRAWDVAPGRGFTRHHC